MNDPGSCRPSLVLLSCGLLAFVPASQATAQPPAPAFQVADLAPGTHNGDAFPLSGTRFLPAELGEAFYFAAQHPAYGVELWRSDGTAEGTELVADLCPGPCSSHPSDFQEFRGRLYFTADDGVLGRELFRLRSGAAPELIADVCPGRCSGFLTGARDPLHVALGRLFMAATDGVSGVELRFFDRGRRIRLVADVCPGACGTGIGQWTNVPGHLFFVAVPDFAPGGNLGPRPRIFRTDGTADGTLDLHAGDTVGRAGRRIVATGSRPDSEALWVLDGTPGGARMIAELGSTDFLGEYRGRLYFATRDALYRTDGTEAGTGMVLPGSVDPFEFAVTDGAIFFFRDGRPGFDTLWTSDGTAAGSRAVARGLDLASSLTAAGGRVFFTQRGRELWTADRGAARRLLNPDEALIDLAAVGGRAYFSLHDDAAGRELWSSDGTVAGTGPVADVHRGPASSDPALLTALGDRLVFTANADGARVWSSDGTAAGTEAVDEGPGRPKAFFPFDGGLIYCTRDFGVPGLWQTDGSAAGTFRRVSGLAGCEGFFPLGADLLLAAGLQDLAFENPVDLELWRTDGTEGGTGLVKDIEPSVTGFTQPRFFSSHPREFARVGDGVAVFTAFQAGLGDELWATDGTTEGTRRVRKLCPELQCSSDPRELVALGERVVFSAHRPDDGREPWVTDGRQRGTRRLARLNPGIAGSDPHGFTVLGDEVVFFARQGFTEKLWATDGTPEGTRKVRQLAFGGRPSSVTEVERLGDRIFFTLYNRRTGAELWVTDGTWRGTRQVTEIAAGAAGAFPSDLTAVGEVLVFAASDGVHGKELWVSDGTAEGTGMVEDIEPGIGSSAPRDFTVVGDLVYFRAHTASGGELWAVPRGGLVPRVKMVRR